MDLIAIQQLIDEEDYTKALNALDEFMLEKPDDLRALFMFGHIMMVQEKPGIAYHVFKWLSGLEPKREQVWVNLGKSLDDLGRNEEAQECYRKALKLDPQNLQATVNMASSAVVMCNYDQAVHWAKKAQLLDPTLRSAHVNLGYAYLMQGKYEKGWEEYEWGLGHMKYRDERVYVGEPRWKGEPNKNVVIYGEQGIGDQIALAQAIPDARRDCKRVILDVAPKLRNLFARSFILETHGDQFNTELDWPFDREFQINASCSLSSLQKYYRNAKHKFSGKPYLVADPVRRTAWRAILAELGDKPKIGIAWTGGTTENQRAARSATLEDLRPILNQDAIFVDLEYKDRSAEIDAFDIKVHSFPWATQTKDYDDTAALVAELDLVIAVPTSVVHLAGALGVECWCLLNKKPHFMFGTAGDQMDWYESIRLFRRNKDEWTEQVNEVAEQLRGWNETRRIDSGRTGTRKTLSAGG